MDKLCFSALDLAAIISSMGLGCRATADFLEQVWEGERPFLQKVYRENKRQLILDTNYWLTYLSDKPAIDAEFPVISGMLWPWEMSYLLTLISTIAKVLIFFSRVSGCGYSMVAVRIT